MGRSQSRASNGRKPSAEADTSQMCSRTQEMACMSGAGGVRRAGGLREAPTCGARQGQHHLLTAHTHPASCLSPHTMLGSEDRKMSMTQPLLLRTETHM